MSLKLKELGDWKMLCQEDKKMLYRVSFCQTFSEFQHPTGTWRLVLGVVLFVSSWGFWLMIFTEYYVRDTPPESLEEFNQKEQLRRMLEIRANPIDGISSYWNYDREDWRWVKITKLDD
ncbi:cytochrome c oxidase subunit 4 isoform 2, mitochondrial-like isoform X2 [Hyposmocoma kahamanoa]|uniref:cytochrome c oxidase subunit 4 isoform 2, mitochondrial-like isoform X2 n=1 Tax=Hyposmocoma kahamanoa TaxID=1477025 RepID=UPI000E6D8D2A|nr:cytochrome c oxidase subunit 4 isoform 2, mitochondrial-like isoform X2 [Hyposmocoma kahamanoa]